MLFFKVEKKNKKQKNRLKVESACSAVANLDERLISEWLKPIDRTQVEPTERFLRVRDAEPGVDLLSRGRSHGLTPDLALSRLNYQRIVVGIEGGWSRQLLARSEALSVLVRHVRVMSAPVGQRAPADVQLHQHR